MLTIAEALSVPWERVSAIGTFLCPEVTSVDLRARVADQG